MGANFIQLSFCINMVGEISRADFINYVPVYRTGMKVYMKVASKADHFHPFMFPHLRAKAKKVHQSVRKPMELSRQIVATGPGEKRNQVREQS